MADEIVTVAKSPQEVKEEKVKLTKLVVECVSGSLVEIFMTALTKNIVGTIGESKLAKFGVRAGGFLLGMYFGGKVSDHICSSIDEVLKVLDDVKKVIDNGGQANG